MRKVSSSMAASALFLGLASGAFAQDNTPKPTAPPQNPAPSAYGLTYLPHTPAASEQRAPLGDPARLARKSAEPKATRTSNDENRSKSQQVLVPHTPAVSFIGSDGIGSNSSSSSVAGHFVLIEFWATWCGPCRHALPGLKQLASEYRDQVEVVSVNEDTDQSTWRSFIDRNQMTWAQQYDNNHTVARRYGVSNFPTYILLDSHGKVITQVVGEDGARPLVDRLGPEIRNALALAGKS